jgi:hypothetical protein
MYIDPFFDPENMYYTITINQTTSDEKNSSLKKWTLIITKISAVVQEFLKE